MIHFSFSRTVTAAFVAGSLLGATITTVGAAIRGSGIFPDVPVNSYFDEAVGEMYGDGVIKGNPDGTYRPADPVSRAEIAVMLKRFKDSLNGVTVRSSSARSSASSSSSSAAAASIATNPHGIFRFTTSSFMVGENIPTVTISVVRTGGNQGSTTVDYAVTGGSATAGTDFETISGTLSFAAKETSKTFTVRILDDATSEGNENAMITLSKPTNSADIAAPGTATLTIVDNETAAAGSTSSRASSASSNPNGTLSLAAATYGVLENVGTMTVTVERTGGSTGAVGIAYSTTNGSGISGADYSGVNGTLSFAAGETTKTFTIGIVDDANVDGAKSFTVNLSSPTGGASLGTSSATVTIFDNESTTSFGSGSLKLIKSSYDVGESEKQVQMTIQRVGGSKGTISVEYRTTNGSSIAGEDYTSKSGTLVFAPGETSKVVTIAITDDSNAEQNEYFFFELVNPSGSTTLSSPSTATINLFD